MPDISVSSCGWGAAAPDEQAAVYSEIRRVAAIPRLRDRKRGDNVVNWSLFPRDEAELYGSSTGS
jgi:hypothetical protein